MKIKYDITFYNFKHLCYYLFYIQKASSAVRRGVSTAYICEDVDDNVRQGVVAGQYQLVYFTPESLLSKTWRRVLHSTVYEERLKVLVFDEAHCIKDW